jgi:hypothetical protein
MWKEITLITQFLAHITLIITLYVIKYINYDTVRGKKSYLLHNFNLI